MKTTVSHQVAQAVAVALALTALVTGCSGRGGPANTVTREDQGGERWQVVHSLVDEAGRLTLDQGGPFIDLGTPDQHKYILGGRGTGWRRGGPGGDPTCARAENGAVLLLDYPGGTRWVSLRVKGQEEGRRLRAVLDGIELGGQPLTGEWQVLDFWVPPGRRVAPGRHRLVLTVAPPRDGVVACVDWVWLRARRKHAQPPFTKVATVNLGAPMRALVVGGDRRYGYYLEVPPKAALQLSYGADAPMRFVVRATWDGGRRVLLDRTTGDGAWHDAQLSLADLGGLMVKLELSSSGRSRRAGWGDPAVVLAGDAPATPVVVPERCPQNLVQVVLDTTRMDLFRVFSRAAPLGKGGLSALGGQSVVFTRAYSNASWTLPATATALSGRYHFTFLSPHHFIEPDHDRIPDNVPLLSEHLRSSGFVTAAFIDNPIVSDPYGFKRGWDRYVNFAVQGTQVGAARLLADALAWIKPRVASSGRWYLYLHLNDAHEPYRFREGYTERFVAPGYHGRVGREFNVSPGTLRVMRRFDDADRRQVRGLYYGQAAEMDHALGAFFAKLERMGVLRNTLVVLSNDHGEELFDHGGLDHGHSLYEELVRSPLVMRLPRRVGLPPARVDAVVELVDVVPTALELLGVPPMPGVHGESLVPLMGGGSVAGTSYAIATGPGLAVRTERYKLITAGASKELLFDLQADPHEQRDIADTHPVARRGAEVLLGEGIGAPAKTGRLTDLPAAAARRVRRDVKLDPKHLKALEALGYINK